MPAGRAGGLDELAADVRVERPVRQFEIEQRPARKAQSDHGNLRRCRVLAPRRQQPFLGPVALRPLRVDEISEAVDELARAGLPVQHQARLFRQLPHDLGRGIDATNLADALETLDGPTAA